MGINKEFLEKALALLPTPAQQTVTVADTVTFSKNGLKITKHPAEDYRLRVLSRGDSICLDFGDHQVGYLHLKLRRVGGHSDAPVPLHIRFAEQPIEFFENPEDYRGAICSGWIQQEFLHVDLVPSELHMPRRYAFRYVKIEVSDISPSFKLAFDEIYCTAVSSADDTVLEPYSYNDELLCRLDKIACRTLHGCMQTVFEDGPKRDRRLWMGDLRLQAQANYETYKNNNLVKACLYLFAALPMPNGQISACLFLEPEIEADDFYMFDYALLYIPTLLDYYNATGDIDTVNELYNSAIKQIGIAEKWIGENGIVIDSEEVGWRFLDWTAELNKQAGSHGVLLYAIK